MYICTMNSGWRLIAYIGICMVCGTSLSAQRRDDVTQFQAQQYLVLDRYGTARIKIPMGSEVTFKLKGDRKKHSARLIGLADSVVIMGDNDIYLRLDDFEAFYFHRSHWKALRYGTLVPAAGFLIAAAVHPTVSNPFYDQEESALIGLGFLALGQTFRLLEWKKFKVNKNARIWLGGIE
jgi:hypothetical protein